MSLANSNLARHCPDRYLREARVRRAVLRTLVSEVWKRARGTELWDVNGRRYLDFLAGAGSLNYGHNNPILKDALLAYIEHDGITHSLDLYTAAKELSSRLWRKSSSRRAASTTSFSSPGRRAPMRSRRAMKIARKVTGRTNIITFTNGFHGVSVGALAATGNRISVRRRRGAAGRHGHAL